MQLTLTASDMPDRISGREPDIAFLNVGPGMRSRPVCILTIKDRN